MGRVRDWLAELHETDTSKWTRPRPEAPKVTAVCLYCTPPASDAMHDICTGYDVGTLLFCSCPRCHPERTVPPWQPSVSASSTTRQTQPSAPRRALPSALSPSWHS